MLQQVGTVASNLDVVQQEEKQNNNEKRFLCELRCALPPVVYNYVHGCKTSTEILDTLKHKYQGSEKTKKSSVKQCLLEVVEFKQKEGENFELYYDCLNELIFKCSRYGFNRSTIEYNSSLLMGLRKECHSVSLMIKTQQCFDNFSLSDLYNELKAHESEVNKIVEETRISLGSPLALMSKVTNREVELESTVIEGLEYEGLIVNSDDEAVAFYSNNKVKKFFKKTFNSKSKTSDLKGSSFVKGGVRE